MVVPAPLGFTGGALPAHLSASIRALVAPLAGLRAEDAVPAAWPSAWMGEALVWISLATLVGLAVIAAGIWAGVVHLRQLREQVARLDVLLELDQKLGRLVADRDDLDLRRLEHVLIDLRDGHQRLEEALLRAVERRVEVRPSTSLAVPPSDESVGERVVNRLLSMGYEQVQIVTRSEKLAELVRTDGEVLVEARKDGVLCKGRALLRGGRLTDVEMNPGYSIFP